MGILNGILGNASEVDIKDLEEELSVFIINNEKIEKAFKLIRDYIVFTNKRLILIDKQGLTGRKTQYLSVPYLEISHFSTETTGHFDLDSELKIWIRGHQYPISKHFKKNSYIKDIQLTIASYVLK